MSWKAPWTRAATSSSAPRSGSKTRGSSAAASVAPAAGPLLVGDGEVAGRPDGGRRRQAQRLLPRDLGRRARDGQEGRGHRRDDEQQRRRHPLREPQRGRARGARLEGLLHEGGGWHRGGRMARAAGGRARTAPISPGLRRR